MNRPLFSFAAFQLFVVTFLHAPLSAQQQEPPYWATLKVDEVNLRVGPSMDYRIDWVYKRKGLPVRVLRVMEGWYLIQEQDGTQGWVARRMVSSTRGAIVVGDELAALRERPDSSSTLRWKLEPGVMGSLGECREGWCELNVDGRTGFILQQRLWGAGEP